MNNRQATGSARRNAAAIPPYVWILALVVLLLAAVACGLWAVYALRLQQPLGGPTPTPIIWTATPPPTSPPLPTPTMAPAATPTLPAEMAIGRYVQVVGTEGVGVNLRQEPDVNSVRISPDIAIGVAQEGEIFVLVGGPRQVAEYTWWQLRDPDNEARQGWAVGTYLQLVDNP